MTILRSALTLGFMFGTVPFASAQFAQSDRPISSDRTTIRAPESSGATVSPGYQGTGREVAGGALESAAEFKQLLSKKPMSAPTGIETILGIDNRYQENPTTAYPHRAVVLITFSAGRCTGWLIGKDTVITAGHCVNRGTGGAAGYYPVASYTVYPGRNGAASPYGSCTAKSLHTVFGWANNGDDQYDYGAIKLNCVVGNVTGWFGFRWTAASLFESPTTISGYPGDKPLTQWNSHDWVRVSQTHRTFYQNDTVGGVSGAPVYEWRAGCGPCSIAVHAYGTYNGAPFNTNNHGTRIREPVFNNFITWRNL